MEKVLSQLSELPKVTSKYDREAPGTSARPEHEMGNDSFPDRYKPYIKTDGWVVDTDFLYLTRMADKGRE